MIPPLMQHLICLCIKQHELSVSFWHLNFCNSQFGYVSSFFYTTTYATFKFAYASNNMSWVFLFDTLTFVTLNLAMCHNFLIPPLKKHWICLWIKQHELSVPFWNLNFCNPQFTRHYFSIPPLMQHLICLCIKQHDLSVPFWHL